MVHRREIDGREIVLGNHGALWGNAMTWFDHETGSVWSQPIGEAILGPLKGTKLELLPSTLTQWGDWKAAHPESFALDVVSNISGFDLETMAVVVELNEQSVAYPVPDLRQVGVANTNIDGVAVAVTVSPTGDNWAVFSRQLNDRVIELAVEDPQTSDGGDGDRSVLREVDGEGRWDAVTGIGLAGTAENLDLLPGFTSFPSDYVTFHPDGAFWQPDGDVITVQEVLSS